MPTNHAAPILATPEAAIERCGLPHELMSDHGTPFVATVRSMVRRFQRTLADLSIRHLRTQIDTPWTNAKIEARSATLQAEVPDRQLFADLAAAEAAVIAYPGYHGSKSSPLLTSSSRVPREAGAGDSPDSGHANLPVGGQRPRR